MPQPDWLFTLKDVATALPTDPEVMRVHMALSHGTMKLELYAPVDVDQQGPHKRDELYVIVSGRGDFIKNGERRPFAPHDVIFVEAGAEHRFVDFTADFATWVIFWGAVGGEAEDPTSPA